MDVRTYACTHVHTRTWSIANSTRKQTQIQINARKLTVAMNAWAISACKRDCDLCVRSKTFRIYYIHMFERMLTNVRDLSASMRCPFDVRSWAVAWKKT